LPERLDMRSEKGEVNRALHRNHVSSVDPSFAVVGWFTICSREIAYSPELGSNRTKSATNGILVLPPAIARWYTKMHHTDPTTGVATMIPATTINVFILTRARRRQP
jgi:hypothetical protein